MKTWELIFGEQRKKIVYQGQENDVPACHSRTKTISKIRSTKLNGQRTFQPWTFQPQASTLDFSNPDFSTMNFTETSQPQVTIGLKGPWLKSLGIRSPGSKCPDCNRLQDMSSLDISNPDFSTIKSSTPDPLMGLKPSWLKSLGLKVGVEKSRFGISCNN